jgi:very-short-patch-repair endonuclease
MTRRSGSELEDLFAFQVRAYRLPPVTREWRFAQQALGRQWRIDFAWPELLVGVEIEGFVVTKAGATGGRHATIQGIRGDLEKYNAAAELGITLLRYESTAIRKGIAINQVQRVLHRRRNHGSETNQSAGGAEAAPGAHGATAAD